MKKSESSSNSKQRNLISRQNYYREIGEQAAVRIFTRNPNKQRINFLSPGISRILSPDSNVKSSKELKILQDLSPRDISHIKDRVKSNSKTWLNLPPSLENLKRSMNSNESLQISSTKAIKKEIFTDHFNSGSKSYEKFSIESLAFGSPSSRQTSENLKHWLEKMKLEHCAQDTFGENAVLVHAYCSKELIRQVSVYCLEQGQVLQEILLFYKGFSDKLVERVQSLEAKLEEALRKISPVSIGKEKIYLEELIEGQKYIDGLKSELEQKCNEISQLKKNLTSLQDAADEKKNSPHYAEEHKTIQNTKRKTFLFGRAGFEPLSPLTPFQGSSDGNFEIFEKPVGLQTAVQTEKPKLVIETFNWCFKDKDVLEKSYANNTCDFDNLENPVQEENYEIMSDLSNEASDKQEEKFEEPKIKITRKMTRARTRVPGKKDPTLKQVEIEKKLQSKQEELNKINTKIHIKTTELDFITQTLYYKKIKEALSKNDALQASADMNTEKILKLKPSYSKAFNLLEDSEFWGKDSEKLTRPGLTRSMTSKLDSPMKEKLEKFSRLNTIRETLNKPEEHSMSSSDYESIRKSIDLDIEVTSELKIQKDFAKRSTSPLSNLSEKLDVFLLEREKNRKKPRSVKILEKICEKDIDWICSRASMARKLLNKLILSLYLSFHSRHEPIEDFLDYVYYDFSKKYGLKNVSDKKFVEFICSLIKASDSKKFSIFLRFLGGGKKISKQNFSQKSLQVFLESLSFLINSKPAINEDFSGRFTVPLSRINELIKLFLEPIDKSLTLKTTSLIEYKSTPDSKRISLGGLVDGDTALETITEQLETLKFKYVSGVEFLMNVLKFNEPKDEMLKYEVMMMMRVVHPQELESFEECFEEFETISLKELVLYATQKKMFGVEELQSFIRDEGKDVEDVESMIGAAKGEMGRIVEEIENVERMMKTLPKQVWEMKLMNLDRGVGVRRPYESIFAFKVYLMELIRVHSTFL